MLDSGVKFTALGTDGIDCGGDLELKYHFTFKVKYKDTFEKYTVDFLKYKNNIFVGKYYPTRYSLDKDRFAFVFDDSRGVIYTAKVLRTVQNIFLHMHKKHPNASFAFIGEPKKVKIAPKKSKGYIISREEGQERTKRFELYRKICLRDIGIESFTLLENTKKSAIILVNNEVKDISNYKANIIDMMERNYNILEL